ncbi:LapA family protein [Pontiella sp.]|uniref:LapA family protein n=1 Tax=Pontiella sp. TaxID=2837462 RepID=UPI003569A378
MVKLKISVALALILLVLIVVFQNREAVETRFLFITFTMPRAALLAITFLVGAAAGLLLSFGMAKHLPHSKE